MKIISIPLIAILITSNAYFIYAGLQWKNAWLSQMLTTSDVEHIYKNSEVDLSKDEIKNIITENIGFSYRVVSANKAGISNYKALEIDEETILFQNTYLIFKDGMFIGSKANLPEIYGPMGRAK